MHNFSNESKNRIFYCNAVSCNERTVDIAKNYEFHFLDLFFIRNQFLFSKIDKEQNV